MSETRLARNSLRRIGLVSVIGCILLISLSHYLLPSQETQWHDVLENCYFVPAVVGALLFGWRGGLGAAVLATILYLPTVIEVSRHSPGDFIERMVEMVVLCGVGLLTGTFADRDRKQRKEIETATAELSRVYRELQNNFDQMKRAERLFAVGQLAAGMAHEIRNPLASVAGAAGILQRNARLEPKYQECIEIIHKECQRLNRLLTDFLDFARPRTPKYQTIDVDSLLHSVIQLAAHGTGTKAVELSRRTTPGLPTIEGDPELLKQMLLNLVMNAIQAMPDGGEVVVSAVQLDSRIQISVRDDGRGVSPADKDKIFDPFFTTKETGTGLGLPVAHQIVEQHGGILTATANEERGMTFSALLPIHQGEII